MKQARGHWLNVVDEDKATKDLGFFADAKADSLRPTLCTTCGNAMALFLRCDRSAYLPLEKFDALMLEFCPSCSSESDGSIGSTGFKPKLVNAGYTAPAFCHERPHYFSAKPTDEPDDRSQAWEQHSVDAKIGGRQLSIQAPLEMTCEHCRNSPMQFAFSIAERWSPRLLHFGSGIGYVFVCSKECTEQSAIFYWDCD